LQWRGREGLELFGIPPGIGGGALRPRGREPDPGWADREADRIVGAGGTADTWVLLSFIGGSELSLADALRQSGAHFSVTRSAITSVLMHVTRE
jgi:hypothetical protein